MIIVTGTGRSGTSFMVQLLSQLYGIDLQANFNSGMNAGLEHESIVRFNSLWTDGKIEEAVGWFVSNLNYYKYIGLFKDPRFFYNNNLHYIKRHFPNLKVIWMHREPSSVLSSAQSLIKKGHGEGQFWTRQSEEQLGLANDWFNLYLKENKISHTKFEYPDLLDNKDFVFQTLNNFIKEVDKSKFNNIWDNLIQK